MLRVIEDQSQIEPDGRKGVVTIESDCMGPTFQDAFNELEGMGVVELAQRFATSKGCAPACMNGNKVGPYPVNSEGLPLEQVRDGKGMSLPQTDARMQPVRYRIDIPVARSFR